MSKLHKEQASHFSNLIALAFADGRLDEKEKELLHQIGSKMGLSRDEIEAKIKNPEQLEIVCPEKKTERYHHLYEMLTMIMIDGSIHPNEVELLKKYAEHLKFEPEIIDPLVEKIKEYLDKGFDNNRIQMNLSNMLNKM